MVSDGGWCYGAAWTDYDQDGDEDLFVVNNRSTDNANFLYRNDGGGVFTKITGLNLVVDPGSSYGCTWADYNGDGRLDLFVSNYNENNMLYRNNGDGTFTRITSGEIVNNGGSSVGCAWADYDLDGFLDLYVCNRTSANFLYRNNGDDTFTRITTGQIVTDNANSGCCVWGDYDGDDDPDLFVANAGAANCLYQNNGDGTFTKIIEGPIVAPGFDSNGANWIDYDNDADLDLLVVGGPVGMNFHHLYRNEGGGVFTEITDSPIVQVFQWAGGSNWADWDNDGDLDLVIGGYDGNNLLFRNEGSGAFSHIDTGVVPAAGNYSMAPVWGDYDDDGDCDLFIAKNNYFGGNNVLFRNDAAGNAWFQVRCVGTTANRTAIGAKVFLRASIHGQSVVQMREISAQTGGGNSGENSLIACFGLGDAVAVEQLRVRWPDGTEDTQTGLSVNQRITVHLGGGAGAGDAAGSGPVTLDLRAEPNPFSTETNLRFTGPGDGTFQGGVFDASGRLVFRMRGGPGASPERERSVVWSARGLPSGTYFVRIDAGGRSVTRTVQLVR